MPIKKIHDQVIDDLISNQIGQIRKYASNKDPQIRKNVSLVLGRLYRDMRPYFGDAIHKTLTILLNDQDERVRQVAMHTLAEIGNRVSALET